MGLYQLSDPRLLGRRVPSQQCCPPQFTLQRIGVDQHTCVRRDAPDPSDPPPRVFWEAGAEGWAVDEPFECRATVRGLYWLLQWDWLLLAACLLQRVSAQRNAARCQHFQVLVSYHSRLTGLLLSSPTTDAAAVPAPSSPQRDASSPPPAARRDEELWWRERFFRSLAESTQELESSGSAHSTSSHLFDDAAAPRTPASGPRALSIRMPSLGAYSSRELIMRPTEPEKDHPHGGGGDEAWRTAALEMGAAVGGGGAGLPAIGAMAIAAGPSHSATALTATAQLHQKLGKLSVMNRSPATHLPASAATPASRLLGMARVSIAPLWRSRYWRSRHLAVLSYHLTLASLLLLALVHLNISSGLYIALLWLVAARGSKRKREALAMRRAWLLTTSLAVLLVLQYALALGLPPSLYSGMRGAGPFRWSAGPFQRVRGRDSHGQLLCETCVRRKFYLYLRGCACDGDALGGGERVVYAVTHPARVIQQPPGQNWVMGRHPAAHRTGPGTSDTGYGSEPCSGLPHCMECAWSTLTRRCGRRRLRAGALRARRAARHHSGLRVGRTVLRHALRPRDAEEHRTGPHPAPGRRRQRGADGVGATCGGGRRRGSRLLTHAGTLRSEKPSGLGVTRYTNATRT